MRKKQRAHSEWLPKLPSGEYDVSFEAIEAAAAKARKHARETHREFASWHEKMGVTQEERDELWDSIKKDRPALDEALQIIACYQLAIHELGNTDGERPLADSPSGNEPDLNELARMLSEDGRGNELL